MIIIGMDETGATNNFNQRVRKVKKHNIKLDVNESKFILVAIIIDDYEHIKLKNKLSFIKQKYNFLIKNNLHARDLFAFKPRNKSEKLIFLNLLSELEDTVNKINFKIYYSFVNVESHIKKYKLPIDPYQISIKRIIERLMMDMKDQRFKFILEGRNYNDDMYSQSTILRNILKTLNDNKIKIDFVSKNKQNYESVIELADLIAYLIRQKLIYKSKNFSSKRGEYFSDEWLMKILKLKMKYHKVGYDILLI